MQISGGVFCILALGFLFESRKARSGTHSSEEKPDAAVVLTDDLGILSILQPPGRPPVSDPGEPPTIPPVSPVGNPYDPRMLTSEGLPPVHPHTIPPLKDPDEPPAIPPAAPVSPLEDI